MPCTIPQHDLDAVIAFHGHSCPGLAIGIRAAELALNHLGHNDDADLVAITETDMCGVDAIQFLTGCTYGKGNLIHRDYGKTAFSFYSRKTGKGFRAIMNPAARQPKEDPTPTDGRTLMREHYMTIPLEEMFSLDWAPAPAPRPACVLQSLTCETCGETMMESRARHFGGQTLCIPCFSKVEQKI